MVILYNPSNGALIEHFRHQRVGEIAPHAPGELKQYDEDIAKELLTIFGFLVEKTPQEAQYILDKPKEAAYKCKYCDFSTDVRVALFGHMRSHANEVAKAKEPVIDPSIIPVAQATPVAPLRSISERRQDELTKDKGFYGPGVSEERHKKTVVMGG